MKIEIDQSGKIEDTAKPTIIAFCNHKTFSIKVTSKTKRQIFEIFRQRGKTRLFIYRTFGVLIFLLIKNYLSTISAITIDTEYPGHEKLIKEIVLELIRKFNLNEPEITFKRIGNRPKVHYAAYNVFSGKKEEDKKVDLNEILPLAIKNDRGQRLKNA